MLVQVRSLEAAIGRGQCIFREFLRKLFNGVLRKEFGS